ncbi:MAG: caspase family protein [Pseudomonadota bacterium]|nr:caspase family protein [Pseudomonadota bacterium]
MGNARYEGGLKLPNAHSDARLIAARLRSAGYDTALLLDAGRDALLAATARLAGQLKDGGVGVFYYAGHGFEIKGQNYLVPVGAPAAGPGGLAQASLPVNSLIGRLQHSGAHLSIVLLDACRNDPDAQLQPRYRGTAASGFVAEKPANGMLIAYATQPGERALDGNGANGPFASALAEWLVKPGLPIEEAIKHVMSDVRRSTRDEQRPWLATSLVGDFALVPAPGARAMLVAAGGGTNVDGSRTRALAPPHSAWQEWYEALNDREQMAMTTDIARQAGSLNRDDLPRLKRAAQGGHVVAASVLGLGYRQGFGIGEQAQRSNVQARKWFTLAARQNMPFALNQLGEMNFLGEGGEPDRRKARILFEAAAARGYMPAKLNLLQVAAESGEFGPAELSKLFTHDAK